MPTGWRPQDVVSSHPVPYINDVHHFDKYHTKAHLSTKIFTWIQFLSVLALMLYLFANIDQYPFATVLQFSIVIFLLIYAYTSFMDNSIQALIAQLLASVIAVINIYQGNGSWLGLNGVLLMVWCLLALAGYYYWMRGIIKNLI